MTKKLFKKPAIIKLRNKLAYSLGYDNFHTMSLELSGQNPEEISALFDELDSLTKDEFERLKREMDIAFSKVHLELMERIKAIFDPNNVLNPGKIFPDGE